jgi:hypothetical protein
MSNGNIFISYRREDTSGHAGRLYDRLKERFPGRVVMDVTSIELGADFVEEIERQLGACLVFIELIGNEWATIKDHDGRRRLDEPGDFVRLEVAIALRRSITIIPILVEGATMPNWSALPEDIAPLTRHEALAIVESDFDHNVERLIHRLESIFGQTTAHPPVSPPYSRAKESHPARIALLIGLGIVGLLIVGAIVMFAVLVNLSPKTDTGPSNNSRENTDRTNENSGSNSTPDKSSDSSNTTPPARSQVTDELHEPAKGSSERNALMDALRAEFSNPQSANYEPNRGTIIFVVKNLKVHNGWAWLFAEPRALDHPNDSFAEAGAFLLHQDGELWRVMKLPPMVADSSDPENVDYPTSRDVAEIRRMYPAVATDIFQK